MCVQGTQVADADDMGYAHPHKAALHVMYGCFVRVCVSNAVCVSALCTWYNFLSTDQMQYWMQSCIMTMCL